MEGIFSIPLFSEGSEEEGGNRKGNQDGNGGPKPALPGISNEPATDHGEVTKDKENVDSQTKPGGCFENRGKNEGIPPNESGEQEDRVNRESETGYGIPFDDNRAVALPVCRRLEVESDGQIDQAQKKRSREKTEPERFWNTSIERDESQT